jgi:NAD(P)-dependent dehydrogenase (short-subunit alcohol dehydrogenase family)
MAREFEDGIAIVAGGSGGIGAAICRDLARHGANVALTYNANQAAAAGVADDVRGLGRTAEIAQLDLRDAQAVKTFVDAMADRHGRIHSLVYASGPSFPLKFIGEVEPETWARVMRTDVEGFFNLIWASLPHLKRQGGGAIVAVITGAVDRPPPKDILSAAPKAAIQALIRGLAKEEGRAGVRANCVGPGWIDAGLGADILSSPDNTAYLDQFVRQIPMRRVGQAEDIAEAVTFLLSDRAKYITGATLPVAGGLQL